MAEKITLEFDINANKADLTLGELRKGFKEMEEALEKTGRGSKQFKELTTAMAQTNREIKNMELSFEALDNEQVASEIGSVAGAIGDVTASFVLMGGENETMQEMAAGIEKAMAISMGFKGAIEGVSSGMKLYNNLLKTGKVQTLLMSAATKVAGVAQMAFNAIMSANPLGIIILAITGVIAAFIAFGGTIKKVMDFVLYPYIVIIDAIIAQLRWLGIMESESAIATRKAQESRTAAVKEEGIKRRKLNKEQIASHRELTESIVDDIDFEIRKRKSAGEDVSRLEGEKLQVLLDSYKEQKRLHIERLALLDEEIARNGDFYNEVSGFIEEKELISKELIQIDKDEKQTTQDILVDAIKKKKEAEDKWADGQEERDKTAFEKRKAADAAKIAQMEVIPAKEAQIIDTKIEGLKKVEEVEISTAENILAAKQATALVDEKLAEEADERRQKRLDLAQEGLNILGAGADAFIKDEIKREKIKKKLAIAQLAIDTARSISSVIAAAASTSITPIDLAIKIAAGLATVLSNIAQAKALLGAPATSAGSLGSAGASSSSAGGGVGINPVSNTSTIIGDQTAVVEVVEINNKQKQVGVIEASATF